MGGRAGGWTDGQTDGRLDEWMQRRASSGTMCSAVKVTSAPKELACLPCCLGTTSSPLHQQAVIYLSPWKVERKETWFPGKM